MALIVEMGLTILILLVLEEVPFSACIGGVCRRGSEDDDGRLSSL